ncbi:MAG: hypothetical protein KIT14_07910 [bacterium]|nr:hypothetical protein [bacterium]
MRVTWAAAILLLAVCAATVAAADPPQLQASAGAKGNVRVRWSFKAAAPRAALAVEVERSDDGRQFGAVARVGRARKRQTWTDRPRGTGPYWYRARVLESGVASAWSPAVRVGAADGGRGPGDPSAVGDGGCPAGVEEEVLLLVNVERAAAGVLPMRMDARLRAAAARRSRDLAASGVLSHDGWIEAIRAAGYGGGALGENIASGYASADAVMSGWMRSTGHRANVLRTYFRDLGVGCARDGRGRLWWVQAFGG